MDIAEQVDALLARGELVQAARLVDERRAAAPADPRLLAAACRVLRLRGRPGDAQAAVDRALSLDPECGRALVERARLAADQGDVAGAHGWYARAYEHAAPGEPWVPEWLHMVGGRGALPEMLDVALLYVDAAPQDATGWFQLGRLLQLARRHDEALQAYAKAASLDPALPMLENNVAAAHLELGDWAGARAILEALVKREPSSALAWNNLSVALLMQHDPQGAEVAAERACALAPDYPVALQTHVRALRERQQWDAALEVATRCLTLVPDDPVTVWTLAMLQLMRGDYVHGWRNHEARWEGSRELRDMIPALPSPRWKGEPLRGRTLFVWGEQGFGDAIQFVRFVPAIAERVRQEGGQLVYCCFAQLHALFSRSLAGEVETIIPHDGPLPEHDFNLPLGSLPLMLGITLEQLPFATRYLRADPDAVAQWAAACGPRRSRLRVGLVWSGSRSHQRNPLRAVDPVMLAAALRDIDDVEFVSLQFDAADDVDAMRRARLRIVDPTPGMQSFDDAAAVLGGLDLVITVCTSVAHLAGAMGVPAWVMLDVNPHWVWMTGRTDSPWYPGVTLYRQATYRHWEPVLGQVARDLRRLAGGGRQGDADGAMPTYAAGGARSARRASGQAEISRVRYLGIQNACAIT